MLCDAIKVLAFIRYIYLIFFRECLFDDGSKKESRENPSFYYVSIHEAAPLYQLEIFHFRISCLL